MLALHVLQHGRYVGPAKVVDSLESGEQAPVGDALEVVLANVLERREVMPVG